MFDLFQRMTEALVIDLPEDPLHYLIEWLKIDNTRKIHATIIGPPGSGKRMLGKTCDPHVMAYYNIFFSQSCGR